MLYRFKKYRFKYSLDIKLQNKLLSGAVATWGFQDMFGRAVEMYNDFFRRKNVRTKNRKFIEKDYCFNPNNTITICLRTQKRIANPNRAGNCLRQLTVFMGYLGGWAYLTASSPGKIFRRA